MYSRTPVAICGQGYTSQIDINSKVILREYSNIRALSRATLIVQGTQYNRYINSIQMCYLTSGHIILPYGTYTNGIGGIATITPAYRDVMIGIISDEADIAYTYVVLEFIKGLDPRCTRYIISFKRT